ncbi:MFS transporter [Rickettsiales endosymbiont of Trichoplax sp. H2]|uniref:MFS transporter n=1 Tax=Rickettsiales endosymbiont of Trichoplax sp. H2 TaxID=2021221 RepID=UPI0012B3150B|nr:MFS transporter [Rickettsiales endosymbiont of Trichoplax sp. H2]MSO13797.1 hypothetical protein [Rickettsiales endosymbiont of Trichoplax sp. H2]
MSSLLAAWSTWLVLAFFYAYQFVQRVFPNIVMDDIMSRYQVNANEIGHFAGIYYVGYIAMHIPLGIMLDHFNAKKVIPLCILLAVAGFAPLAYIDNFTVASYGRLLIGIGSSGAAVGAFKLLRLGFGEEKFPRMLGWMVTIGLLGAVFGSGPLARFILYLGWEETLKYILLSGIILAALSYFIIPNTKSDEKFNLDVILKDFKYLFSNKMVFLVCILGGFMIGPLEGFADAWSNPYLKTVYKLTNAEAGDITQLVYIGMAVGLVIMGFIFEKIKSYYGLLIISGAAMLACFIVLLMNLVQNPITLKLMFFVIGFFCSYQILIIAKSVALVHVEHATFISAVANMIMMGFGYFSHRAIGMILHHFWDGMKNNLGVPIYSVENFYNALVILIVSLAIAIVGFVLLVLVEKNKKKIS